MVDVDAKKETRLKGGFPILSFVYRGGFRPQIPQLVSRFIHLKVKRVNTQDNH